MTPITIEQLPPEAIGIILGQLNLITGSEGILNESDIPVVMRYAMNLACTSKTMYRHVHSLGASRIFLLSLTSKYGQSPEHFASKLDTLGARQFLWDNIQKNGDKKSYEVIQAIYTLVTNVKKEAQEEGVDFNYSEGRHDWPFPNSFYYQTRSGFFLYNNWGPSHLATPFGEIKLFGSGSSRNYSPLSVSEVFIRRLGATFEGLTSSMFEEERSSIVAVSPLPVTTPDKIREISTVREISKETAEGYKGSQMLVAASLCGKYSIYQINEVGGEPLPKATWHEGRGDQRSSETINKIWEMLEIERLGGNPCLKPPCAKKARAACSTETTPFDTCAEIIPWALKIVDELKHQPVFRGKGSCSSRPIKVMRLENYSFARVLEMLHKASKAEGYISAFGRGNNSLRDESGKDLGEGVELWGDPSKIDLAGLPIAYRSVLAQIGSHWKFALLKDYPNILHTESEEDSILLIKDEPSFREEDTLIRFLASLTGISKFITCCNNWKGRLCSSTQQPLYLWIKKRHLAQVATVLGLSL